MFENFGKSLYFYTRETIRLKKCISVVNMA